MATLLASGCSLAMTGVPKDWHPSQPPRCTTSSAAPLGDIALGAVSAALQPVLAIPWAISALRGLHSSSKCARAQQQHEEWLRNRPRPMAQPDADESEPSAAEAGRLARLEPATPPADAVASADEADEAPHASDEETAAEVRAIEAERAAEHAARAAIARAEAAVDDVLREIEQAASRASQRERARRADLQRRAWLALTPAERRRWQRLPARDREVVRERAIARQIAVDELADRPMRQRAATERERRATRLRQARAAVERAEAAARARRTEAEQARRARTEDRRLEAERERAEQERVDQERVAAERAERARAETERAERARAEAEREAARARTMEEQRAREEAARDAERRREAKRREEREPPAPAEQPPLRITHCKPDRGSAAGGDIVAIIGTGFAAYKGKPLDVYFGKRQATIIGFSGDSKLVVETPAGEADSTVTVRVVVEYERQLSLVSAYTYE